jgi:hypothetical protein
MTFSTSLDDIVLFELLTRDAAEELLKHVSSARLAWMQPGPTAAVVGVLLNPVDEDLAALMRQVEAWAANKSLAAVRFEVDGKTYVLEPFRRAEIAAA